MYPLASRFSVAVKPAPENTEGCVTTTSRDTGEGHDLCMCFNACVLMTRLIIIRIITSGQPFSPSP